MRLHRRLTIAALIVTLALVLIPFAIVFAAGPNYGPYALEVPIVIDGDSFHAKILIWPQHGVDTEIRVAGVDTPEIEKAKCPEEKAAGLAAKAFAQSWIDQHKPLTANHIKADAYPGRFDAEVIGADGSLLAGALIAAGQARGYDGKTKRQPWCAP